MKPKPRQVSKIIEPESVLEGAGVRLKRSIAGSALDYLDPFLLFDDFGSNTSLSDALAKTLSFQRFAGMERFEKQLQIIALNFEKLLLNAIINTRSKKQKQADMLAQVMNGDEELKELLVKSCQFLLATKH